MKRLYLTIMALLLVSIMSACKPSTVDAFKNEPELKLATAVPSTTQPSTADSTPPPNEVAKEVDLLISDWFGWKPIIDANGGLTADSGSIYAQYYGIDLAISSVHAEELTTEVLADALINQGYNAIGCFVNQYAEIYPLLLDAGLQTRVIYSPAVSRETSYFVSKGKESILSAGDTRIIASRRGSNELFLARTYLREFLSEDDYEIKPFETFKDAEDAFVTGENGVNWLTTEGEYYPDENMNATEIGQNPQAVIGVIVVTSPVVNNNNLVDGFVKGAAKAADEFSGKYSFIRKLDIYKGFSNDDFTAYEDTVEFTTERGNRDILYSKNYAEDAFIKASRYTSALEYTTTPWDSDMYYLGALPRGVIIAPEQIEEDDDDDGGIVHQIPIHFVEESASFVNGNQVDIDLKLPIEEMKANTSLSIIVRGYVSKPKGVPATEEGRKLSQKRADAVKAYLEKNGIDSERITAIGMGEKCRASRDSACAYYRLRGYSDFSLITLRERAA